MDTKSMSWNVPAPPVAVPDGSSAAPLLSAVSAVPFTDSAYVDPAAAGAVTGQPTVIGSARAAVVGPHLPGWLGRVPGAVHGRIRPGPDRHRPDHVHHGSRAVGQVDRAA